MCGIAGFYHYGAGDWDVDELKKMTGILAHRGPDADGHFLTKSCGLGHRRLSILDLSDAANQPFFSADGKTVIVFNGEVYNFREIAQELHINLRTTSDTEVILEAFLKWGPDMVQRLNGMFAIAIYSIETDELFLFRDRLGIKPIYIYEDSQRLIFASELKAILGLRPKISLSLNKSAVRDYLHLGYIPEPWSICNEVSKFPSGTWARIHQNGMQLHSYWQPESFIHSETISNEDQATEQLHQLVLSSVNYRMIADVPFGTFLSGGIDSSLVTAVAQHLSLTPVNTFSIGFKESEKNESDFAKAVSKHLKTHHHEFMVSENDAKEMLLQMFTAFEEPFADSSAIPTMLVSKLARQHVTMTLSGDGGDELFMGYGFYNWAKRMNHPLVKILRSPIGAFLSRHPSSRVKRAAHHFEKVADEKSMSHIFSQEIYYYSNNEIERIFLPQNNPHLFKEPQFNNRFSRHLNPQEQQALFDIRYYLKDDLLCKVDRSTMQYSLETRVPLLDYRIVEFALNLDPSLKIKDGASKYLLKKILFNYVPKSMFNRPKWGFGIPLDKWLAGDLSYLMDTYASSSVCEKYGLVDGSKIQTYVAEFKSGRTYYYNRIWQIIMLHATLEQLDL
ncbi:MAG: asparagine synthase (glutamine-hydrolyzing) [Bacteroidia bacterium]|jgi:asparagine synthase (glutamine-hydrolysing)